MADAGINAAVRGDAGGRVPSDFDHAPGAAADMAPGSVSWAARTARVALTAPLVLYSRVISPALPRRCKYEPPCSAYAIEAVRSFGAVRGFVLAAWRLLRCNPFSDGGYDPVQAQRVFKRHEGAAR